MPIKILATADIHMGKRSTHFEAGRREASTVNTWNAMVDKAIESAVDFVVLPGDVVDRENRYFEALGPLQSGLERLAGKGIHVLLTAGNHDHDVLPDLLRQIDHPNVRLLGARGQWESWETEVRGMPIRFLGWSFPNTHHRSDPMFSFPGYPDRPELVTVGLLHGDHGNPASTYAPIDPAKLVRQEVDVWVLGHIHKSFVHRQDGPMVFYPGSPHAMSPKEDGPHGPVLLEIEGRGSIAHKAMPMSPILYETLAMDLSGRESPADARDQVMVRIREHGQESQISQQGLARIVYDLELTVDRRQLDEWEDWKREITAMDGMITGGCGYSVRKAAVYGKVTASELEEVAKEPTDAGELAKALIALERGGDNPLLTALRQAWAKEYKQHRMQSIYQPLWDRMGATDLETDRTMNEHLRQQGMRLLDKLLKQRRP